MPRWHARCRCVAWNKFLVPVRVWRGIPDGGKAISQLNPFARKSFDKSSDGDFTGSPGDERNSPVNLRPLIFCACPEYTPAYAEFPFPRRLACEYGSYVTIKRAVVETQSSDGSGKFLGLQWMSRESHVFLDLGVGSFDLARNSLKVTVEKCVAHFATAMLSPHESRRVMLHLTSL